MLRFKFLIAFLFICHLTVSQTKFEKGYFKKYSGDSISCYIKNLKWLYAPNKIVYKTDLNGKEIESNVSEVSEFQVEGGPRFIAVKDSFPITERFLRIKGTDQNPKLVERHTFVKQIIDGEASLYQYRGSNDLVYLISLKGQKPIPLLYKQYIKAGSNDIKENNIFKRQLLKLVNCGGNEFIQKVTYDEKELKNYVTKFNLCKGGGIETPIKSLGVKEKEGEIRLKIIGGIVTYDYSTMLDAFEGAGLSTRLVSIPTDFENKISPSFGLELESILPFNNRKWAIFLSSQFASYSAIGSASLNGSEVKAAEIELSQLIFNLGGRHYIFLNDENSFTLATGVVFDYNVKANFTEEEDFVTPLTDLNKTNLGLFFGVGYSINQKWYLNLNYLISSSINENTAQENDLKRLALSIGIKI